MDPSSGLPPPKRIRRSSLPGSFPGDVDLQKLRQKLLQPGAPVPVTPTHSIRLEKMKCSDDPLCEHKVYSTWKNDFKHNRALISSHDYSHLHAMGSNCFLVDGVPHRIVESCEVPRGKIQFPPYCAHARSCAESFVVSKENCTLIPLTFASLEITVLQCPDYCKDCHLEVMERALFSSLRVCCERTPLTKGETYFCICSAMAIKEDGNREPVYIGFNFQLKETQPDPSQGTRQAFFLDNNTNIEIVSGFDKLHILDDSPAHSEVMKCVMDPVLNGTNQVRLDRDIFETHRFYNSKAPFIRMGGYYFGVTFALKSALMSSVSVNESTYRQLIPAEQPSSAPIALNVQFPDTSLPMADKACISLSWFKADDSEWFKAVTHACQILNRAPIPSEAELLKAVRNELHCVPLQKGRIFQVSINYPDGSLGLLEAKVTSVFSDGSQQSQPDSAAFWGTSETELHVTLGAGVQYASSGNSEQKSLSMVERLCSKVGGVRPQARKIMRDVIYPWYLYNNKKSLTLPPAGIILHGPSGTGKTSLARELGEIIQGGKGCVRVVKGPELLNRYIGVTEASVKKLFDSDNPDAIQVVIIDEMEAIFGTRHFTELSKHHDTAISQFLTCMDGVEKAGGLLFIGTTNNINAIDAAIKRPGRMEYHYEVGLPDKVSRAEILKVHCQRCGIANTLSDEDYVALAGETPGTSGADLEQLVSKSVFKARTNDIDLEKCTQQDLEKSLDGCVELKRSHFDAVLQEASEATLSIEAKLDQELPVADEKFVQLECQKNAPEASMKPGSGFGAVKSYLNRVSRSQNGATATVVITGPAGVGKTRLARELVQSTQFSHLHVIKGKELIGQDAKCFSDSMGAVLDACKEQKRSVIVIDNFDLLLDERNSRPMALNALHSWADTGKALKNRSCVLIVTSRAPGLASVYSGCKTARNLQLDLLTPEDMKRILEGMNTCSEDISKIVELFPERISIGDFIDSIKPCYTRDDDGGISWDLDALEGDLLACTEKETFSYLYS